MPRAKRREVAVTYLLARFADTLTDCGKWPTEERLNYLQKWENAVVHGAVWNFSGNVGSFTSEEAELLLKGGSLLESFSSLPEQSREMSKPVLQTLFQGMRWDLGAFRSGGSAPIFGVKDESFFDWYCYSVAGCVGAYWVSVFDLPAHLEPLAVAYGKGLQRINILRDVPKDWARGRIYLPKKNLEALGFETDGTKKIWEQKPWHDYVKNYCAETEKLLLYGAHFCDSLPYRGFRLRWASLMPLMIGVKTLEKLKTASFAGEPIKISRRQVKKLALWTLMRTAVARKITPELMRDA